MATASTPRASPVAAWAKSLHVIRDAVDSHGLLLFVVGAYVAEQVSLANRFMTSDSWLALLTGRRIETLGLPHVDRWTVIANGRTWVDQQWLAQFVLFRVQAFGGLRLVVLLGLLLAVGSLALAIVLAVRKGATPRVMTWLIVAAVVPYGRSADNLRAQSLCYLLFLALVWLLTRPRSRVSYAVFPLLVLWANLHGSVVLAAALVSGCAVLRRRDDAWWRALVFGGVPWLCIFGSPYAVDLPRYYRTLLVNPAFGHYVAEWKPMTLSLLDAPTIAIICVVLILVGTGRSGWSREEGFILGICAVLAMLAVRNAVWLALAAIVFVTPAASRVVEPLEISPFARRVNRLLVSLAAASIAAAVAVTATRPTDWFAGAFPAKAANIAATAAGPRARIFATEDFADWLIWQRPELGGRVSFDARLELLRASELRRVFALEGELVPDRVLLHGYDVFVVPPDLVGVVRGSSSRSIRVLDRERGLVVLAAG